MLLASALFGGCRDQSARVDQTRRAVVTDYTTYYPLGIIRWDGWMTNPIWKFADNVKDSMWSSRWPFFVSIHGGIGSIVEDAPATMDAEITFANNNGISYFASCFFGNFTPARTHADYHYNGAGASNYFNNWFRTSPSPGRSGNGGNLRTAYILLGGNFADGDWLAHGGTTTEKNNKWIERAGTIAQDMYDRDPATGIGKHDFYQYVNVNGEWRPLVFVFDLERVYYEFVGGTYVKMGPPFGTPNPDFAPAIQSVIATLRTTLINKNAGNPYVVCMDGTPEFRDVLAADTFDAYTGYNNGIGVVMLDATHPDNYYNYQNQPNKLDVPSFHYPASALMAAQTSWTGLKEFAAVKGAKYVPNATQGYDTRPRWYDGVTAPATPTSNYFGYGFRPDANSFYSNHKYYDQATPDEFGGTVRNLRNDVNANATANPARTATLNAWNEFEEGGRLVPGYYDTPATDIRLQKVRQNWGSSGPSLPGIATPWPGTTVTGFGNTVSNLANGTWVGVRLQVGNTSLQTTMLTRYCQAGDTAAHATKIVRVSDGQDVPNGSATITCTGTAEWVSSRPVTVELAYGNSYRVVTQVQNGNPVHDTGTVVSDPGAVATIYGPTINNQDTSNAGHTYGPVGFTYTLGASSGNLNLPSPTGPLQFVKLPKPCRILDTRPGQPYQQDGAIPPGFTRTYDVQASPYITLTNYPYCGLATGIPTNASAFALNVTLAPTNSNVRTDVTVWPAGQAQPGQRTMSSDGRTRASAVVVPAGAGGKVSVNVKTNPTDVLIDINGYFVPTGATGGLYFHPITPCRIVDTRNPVNHLPSGVNRSVPIRGGCSGAVLNTAQAYSLNITATGSTANGWLTAWPDDGSPAPSTSVINFSAGQTVANAVLMGAGNAASNGAVKVNYGVYTGSGTMDYIVDINGYFDSNATGGLSYYPVAPCTAYGPTQLTSPGSEWNVAGWESTITACNVGSNTAAVLANATVFGRTDWMTLWPGPAGQGLTSTLNAYDGSSLNWPSNMAIVPTQTGSAGKTFMAYTAGVAGNVFSQPTVEVDVMGYFQ